MIKLGKIPEMNEPVRCGGTDFISSEFVEIKSNEMFEVQMQYPILGMKYAEECCCVRKEVYNKLTVAAKLLPAGYKIKILDAWRPFVLQEELYNFYSHKIITDFGLENCSEIQKQKKISEFVSLPVPDRNFPPVHTTGGAIDVTIVRRDGCELDMGTRFDDFTEKAYSMYYEKNINETIRSNRRLLYNIMIQSGFTNFPSEWWHYDYGDWFWAYYKCEPAIYPGVFTKEEIYEIGKT